MTKLVQILFFCLIFVPIHHVYAQENIQSQKIILDTIRKDERVIDILTDFPEIQLQPHFNDKHGIWIIEFIHENAGEVGLVTVSPETKKILEFNFYAEKFTDSDTQEGDWHDDDDESEEEMDSFSSLKLLLPHFDGMALTCLSFLLTMILLGDFKRLFSVINFDIVLLHALAPFLILTWSNTKLAYTGIFIITFMIMIRCLYISFQQNATEKKLNFSNTPIIGFLLLFAFFLHVTTIYTRGIGDAGLWAAIGADYLWQTGHLPYGTEFGSNCIYGPLMYVLFLPANILISAGITVIEPGFIQTPAYHHFAMHGIQTTVLILDILTLWALFMLARRSCDKKYSLAIVVIYAISPYLLGIRSEIGIERASHVVGMPFILLALLFIQRPFISGTLLGFVTGMLYYPIFLTPLWLGFLWRNGGFKNALKFIGSYAAIGMICLVMIVWMVHPIQSDRSALNAFIGDSISQQQFKDGYGNSSLSFWGQYPTISPWGKSLTGVLYTLFCLSLILLPRRIDLTRMLVLSSSVLVGSQLVLSHGGGTYIGFYLALLVLSLFQKMNKD